MAYPATILDHQSKLARTTLAVLLAIQRLWRRLEPGGSWEQQYDTEIGPQVLSLVLAAQVSVTNDTDAHVARLLNELDFGPTTQPGVVPPTAFTGLAGDGRPVDTLLETSVGRARAAESRLRETTVPSGAQGSLTITRPTDDAAIQRALAEGERFMETVTATILADTARAAESVAMTQREWVDGYVRVISPPCCSRCAVLAGKFFLWNDGFLRHPRCDCKHIPAPARGPALDALLAAESPRRYFDSLTEAEQDKVFTGAGATAIRLGADMGQVVNARRGMSTAQDSIGRDRLMRNDDGLFVTTEGMSRRGTARRRMRGQRTRLMPESILKLAAGDRDEAIRLLRANGYLT